MLQKDARSISAALIQKTLSDFGIVKGFVDAAIGLVALWVSEENEEFKKNLVAKGISPEHGRDAQLEILAGSVEQRGVEQDDGTIDFSSLEPDFNIERGTVVARLHHAKTGGADGEDLKGNIQVGNLQQEIISEMAAGSYRVQDDQMISE